MPAVMEVPTPRDGAVRGAEPGFPRAAHGGGARGDPRGDAGRERGPRAERSGAARREAEAGLSAAGAAARGMSAAKPGRRPRSADGGGVM